MDLNKIIEELKGVYNSNVFVDRVRFQVAIQELEKINYKLTETLKG